MGMYDRRQRNSSFLPERSGLTEGATDNRQSAPAGTPHSPDRVSPSHVNNAIKMGFSCHKSGKRGTEPLFPGLGLLTRSLFLCGPRESVQSRAAGLCFCQRQLKEHPPPGSTRRSGPSPPRLRWSKKHLATGDGDPSGNPVRHGNGLWPRPRGPPRQWEVTG